MFEPLVAGHPARSRPGTGGPTTRPATRRVAPRGHRRRRRRLRLHRMFRADYDVRVWVEAPYDVRLARGVERDGEDARGTWVERWMPMEDATSRATTRSRAPTSWWTARLDASLRRREARGCVHRVSRPGGSYACQPVHRSRRAALFFALGGSAVAVNEAVKPQARCRRAPSAASSRSTATRRRDGEPPRPVYEREACDRRAVQLRRRGTSGPARQQGVYEVRFPGNAAAGRDGERRRRRDAIGHVGGGVFRVNLGCRAGGTRSTRRSSSSPCEAA